MGMWSALACWAAAAGPGPTLELPSDRSTIAAGTRLPPCLGSVVSECSAVVIASPMAVPPPPGRRPAIAALASAWSVVGDCTTTGRRANWMRPTLTLSGMPETNVVAAFCAAPSREGFTSVALIELEMSLANMIAALLTGTATVRCGRAAAAMSRATAMANTSIGAWRRQPGRRGVTDSVRMGAANAAATFRRRRCWPAYQRASTGTAIRPTRTNGEEKLMGTGTGAPPGLRPPGTSPRRW